MKILYIFPHPDDESFGPAAVMSKQIREGHEVCLFTLTKGGATKQREKLGLSVAEMGEVRYDEMKKVAKVLGLHRLNVLDLPDGGLKELDPREIEAVIREEIETVNPQVVVTYAVHGISGFADHLVCHAVVKRVFVEMKDEREWLKRLALYTLTEEQAAQGKHFPLKGSKPEDIDCIVKVSQQDIETTKRCLDCYETYKEMIEQTEIKEHLHTEAAFEVFGERMETVVDSCFEFI